MDTDTDFIAGVAQELRDLAAELDSGVAGQHPATWRPTLRCAESLRASADRLDDLADVRSIAARVSDLVAA